MRPRHSHRTACFAGLTAAVETGQFGLTQSILETALGNAAENALARAEIVAALPAAREGVAANASLPSMR